IDALSTRFTILEDKRSSRTHAYVVFGRPGDPGSIDLHQAAPGPAGVAVLDHIANSAAMIDIAGARARLAPIALHILIAILHDQFQDGHFWRGGFNLRHLLDIATLAEHAQEADWRAVAAAYPTAVVRAAGAAQLLAAKHIAGARVPVWMLADKW